MKRSRHRLWAIALCAMALGVMGMGASSAQAAKPNWNVNGAELPASLLPSLAIIGHKTLLAAIVGIHFELLCSFISMITGHLVSPNKLLGSIRFFGCKAYLNNLAHTAETAACKPIGGEVVTTEIEGELKAGENNIVLKPKAGTEFATIETEGACAVGEEIPIEGVLAGKETGGLAGLESEATEHTFEENAAKTSLTVLGNAAKLLGTDKVSLSGAHNGMKWSGKP